MEIDDQIHCKFPNGGVKLGHKHKMDDEEDGGIGRFYGWPSSRIVRVSRASGGKDRHSKVLTSKGLRDRRVRLSVNTAIQFYDLQDRLGYDQPSKAVEWLLKAAESSIAELPPMNSLFPDTPKQMSDEKRTSICEMDLVTKSSACSSNSENSKGSGLSLSRSESRVRAREKAKERVAAKETESTQLNPISHTTSFTELLNGGLSNNSSSPMEYFSSGMLAPPSSAPAIPFTAAFNELHRYSFAPDHYVPVVGGGGSQLQHYNLNFNRGTLQSNSSSLLPHLQRFSDGGAPSFFISAAENRHQFVSGYDSRGLQLLNSGQRGKDKN